MAKTATVDEPGECPECGSPRYTVTDCPEEYQVLYDCPACGYEGQDCYADLYGVMSVPWGHML